MANNKDFKVKNGIQPTVYHEGLGTVVSGSVGYGLANASYDGVSFSVASQDGTPFSLFFKPTGDVLYLLGYSNDTVYQYSLSTSWDISTASYASKSFSVTSEDSVPYQIFFKSDGTKMYMVGAATDSVYQYTLSTAWDISTASYDSVSFSISSQETAPSGLSFKTDGTKMYVGGAQTDSIYQYTLSTAWDISTASYDSVSYSYSSVETGNRNVVIINDGYSLFTVGADTDTIYEHTLGTAWDLSTASYSGNSFSVTSQDTNPAGLFFKDDGTKMYMVGITTDTIYQYSTVLTTASLDLSTGSVFEITPTSDIQINLSNPADSGTVSQATLLLNQAGYGGYALENASYDSVSFSIVTQDAVPQGLFFKSDGTSMYMLGATNNTVYQYDMTTAWDISTASYASKSFSVASQETGPKDLVFKPDGTKMYLIGSTGDSIYQYSLSTAWDISTSSYDSVSLSVSGQDTVPTGLSFNNDGTKIYITGNTNDTVYQYSLSTAYDLSTASYDSISFSVSSQDNQPWAVEFNDDGTKMYVTGITNTKVHQYSLSTAYNISTASYDSVSLDTASQATSPRSSRFKSDGSKMYVIGGDTDAVYQYSTVQSTTITYPSTLEWPSGTAPTSPAIGETDVLTFSTTDGGTTYQAVQAIDGAS